MLKHFKAIFFDAGGTLLHPFPSVGEIYAEVSLRHGAKADASQLESRFRKAWLHRDGLSELVGHSSEKVERQWWRHLVAEVFAEEKSIRNFDAFFDELYEVFGRPEVWRLYPGTIEVIEHFKSKQKYLGIISNWDSRLFKLCEGLGLSRHFRFVLASAVFGASKPSPKIFQEALKQAGVEPHEAVHIGDSLEDDIQGAQAVGIQTVLINRHPERKQLHPEKLEKLKVIHDLRELIEPA